jgi:hypothetical protein
MPYNMTQTEYADHAGISQARISVMIKQGKLRGAYRKKKGRYYIDPKKADIALSKNLDPQNPSRVKSIKKKEISEKKKTETIREAGIPLKMDLNTAKTLNEQYKAGLNKLKYEAEQKKLIPADMVEKAAFEVGRKIRDQLLSIPDRCAPLVAVEDNQIECKQIILKEITNILKTLSDALSIQ